MKLSELIKTNNPESTYLGLKMLKDSPQFSDFIKFVKPGLSEFDRSLLERAFDQLCPENVKSYFVMAKFNKKEGNYAVGIFEICQLLKKYEDFRNDLKK